MVEREKTPLGSYLAATLRRLRIEKGLSQEALAEKSGLDRTYISLLERNLKNVTLGTLEKIIPHLAPTPVEFFHQMSQLMSGDLSKLPPVSGRVSSIPLTPEGAGDAMDGKLTEEALRKSLKLLDSITRAQSWLIEHREPRTICEGWLKDILSLTDSQYGFVAELKRTINGEPFLKALAVTNLSPNPETQKFFEAQYSTGLEFYNMKSLFGAAVTSGKIVISNDPSHDPRRGGTPEGHPPLLAFLGIPLSRGDEMVGMLGIANRSGGYDTSVAEFLEPMVATCAALIESMRRNTERQHTEERLRFQAQVIDQVHDSLIMTNTEGYITRWNKGAERMTGYSAGEMIGRHISIVTSESKEEHDRSVIVPLLETGSLDVERQGRRKNGENFFARVALSVIRDTAGSPVGLIGYAHDITAHKHLEEKLRQSQKMEAVGRLAGGIAHDFNNLLTIIKGQSDLLFKQLQGNRPLAERVEEVRLASKRAALLTQQLLAFGCRQVMQLKPLDLNKLISGSKPKIETELGDAIVVIMTLEKELKRVLSDPAHLEQMILSLAVNARDAMPNGGNLNLATSNHHDGPSGYVSFTVTDTGKALMGIEGTDVFEPFANPHKDGKGTGLELSTVYGIVKQCGGQIRAKTGPSGTSFEIFLPIAKGDDDQGETKTPRRGGPSGGKKTILLVDDEAGVRQLAREILDSQGYCVIEVGGSTEALQICREHDEPIHLLLTDLAMPQINGKQLAAQLVSLRPEMKVLYVSGYGRALLGENEPLSRETAFLQKPFEIDNLLSKVRELLEEES